MNKHIKKYILSIAILITSQTWGIAGSYTIESTPATDASTGSIYMPISKDDALFTGVSFSASITSLQFGNVDNWYWTFQNGSPGTSTSQTPGTVTFGSGAYGQSNAVTMTFCHFGSTGLVCSNPLDNKIKVNVIKPTLAFNFSSWAQDDTAHAAASTAYSHAFTINVLNEYTIGLASTCAGIPYEYQVTVTPANSDSKSTDLDIKEQPSTSFVFYKGTAVDTPNNFGSTPSPAYYRSQGFVCDPFIMAPSSPTMYAFDAPGPEEEAAEDLLSLHQDNKVVITKVLTSYPLYKYPSNSVDVLQSQSHTFTYTCTSDATNGSGPYHWTASP